MVNPAHSTSKAAPWIFGSRFKLFITLFLVLAIPTAMLMILTGLFVGRLLSEEASAANMSLARITAHQVSDDFFGLRRYVESFAGRARLIEAIKAQDEATLTEQLADMVEQNRKVSRGVFINTNGFLISDFPKRSSGHSVNFSQVDWFKGVVASDKPYVSDICRRTEAGESDFVIIAAKVRDDEGRLLGYLIGEYDINDLAVALDSVRPHESGEICLFDHAGHQAVPERPHTVRDISQTAVIERLLTANEGSVVADFDGGGEFLIGHVPIPDMGWTVIAYQPTSVVFAPVHNLQRTILLFFIVALGAIAILGMIWHRLLYRYESDLRKSNQELERLCYSIAHDLRAPLRAMSGFTFALREETKTGLSETAKEYAERIANSAARMDTLVNDLLEYGYISHTSLTLRPIDVDPVVQEVLFNLQDRIEQLQAKIEIKQPLGRCCADKLLLSEIFVQLLDNALKYRKPNSVPHIFVWSELRAHDLRLFVRDNGIGIEREYFNRIFGVFERLHGYATYSGTGIGLAIVKRAVDRMEGTVGVESVIDEGATFWFQLPLK